MDVLERPAFRKQKLVYLSIDKKGLFSMKILFFQWHSFMNQGIEHALKRQGIDYDTFFYQFSDWEKDDTFLQLFSKRLKDKEYRCILSVNFSPLISNVCEERNIPYIAWVYDAPLHIRNLSSINNSCTNVYFFDRGQAEELKKNGMNARYMPLAVDTEVFWPAADSITKEDYAADVSLVGKLYQTEYQYYKIHLNEYLQGYLEGIIGAQMKIYGGYLIPELITQDLLNQMNTDYKKTFLDGFQMGKRELEYLLACEVTGRERYLVLQLLSEHYKVALYSTEEDDRLVNVQQKGYADYYTQMPAVFSKSKVNLNISLKTIRTGIPLRIVDIMGCGGFVISNYQEELVEYFVPGEECVVYENLEDLFEKVQFYLEHDAERQRIVHNSFEKVKRDFTFDQRLKKMLCEYVV